MSSDRNTDLMSIVLVLTIATYILQSWFATWSARTPDKKSADNSSDDGKAA